MNCRFPFLQLNKQNIVGRSVGANYLVVNDTVFYFIAAYTSPLQQQQL